MRDLLEGKQNERASSPKAERLPGRDNFIEWYNSLLSLAEIADKSYPVKGTFVWMPYGLRIMKGMVSILDAQFRKYGIEEVLFPLLVPREFAEQNDKWFSTFSKEAFYIEGKELLLRPTGEPAMYPIFKLWIKRGMLPIRVYETVSSYRNESKTTHTLIRDREIGFWHEIHTVHKTREESISETEKHREIYAHMWRDVLDIPPIVVVKPKYEIFAGAESAFEFYTILPDGKLLENGSINNLGQAYAKKFDLRCANDKGELDYVWQVCTGNGARFLAAVMAVHGDEKGLVLPPKIAPISVVIVPIFKTDTREKMVKEAEALVVELSRAGIEARADTTDASAGEKFNIWELKGVPIRIELGEREITEDACTVFRRDQHKKYKVNRGTIVETLHRMIYEEIPHDLLAKAEALYESKIVFTESMESAKKLIDEGKVVKANWCESQECYDALAAIWPSTEAVGTIYGEERSGKCISCGKSTTKLALIGKTY